MTQPSSSPNSNDTPPVAGAATRAGASQSAAGMPIAMRVQQIAAQCAGRNDFLRYLAGELQQRFGAGLVAVEAADWEAPMMLVTEERTAQRVNRDAIRGLLQTAQSSPIACTVPAGEESTRGLRVELSPVPARAALLLLYPIADSTDAGSTADAQRHPTPAQQIEALRLLNEYAVNGRRCLATLWLGESDDQQASSPADTTMIKLDEHPASSNTAARDALRTFHRDLDLTGTAYRIANETRSLLNCDRVTVLIPKGNRLRVKAISGVAVVDPRSNAVRTVERMSNQAAVMSRPLILPGDDVLPPQIQAPLDDYLDETGVASCVLLPLHGPDNPGRSRSPDDEYQSGHDGFDPFDEHGELLGVIALEYFAGHNDLHFNAAMRIVASEAALALRNSLEHHQVFGLPVLKAVGQAQRSSNRVAWGLGIVTAACLLAASLIVQVDHRVIATGHAEPQSRRNVFAGIDGVVTDVLVTNGQAVNEGDPLLKLENADLEARVQALTGELQTSNDRLASIKAMRLGQNADAAQTARLAMEERQLTTEIQGLQRQQELINEQINELTVRSPITGHVIAWRLAERLSERPVSRGNHLMTVVDESGDWELSLSIPDGDAGPVLESAKAEGRLEMSFAIATKPRKTFSATLTDIATATRLNESGQYVIDVTASVDRDITGELDSSDGVFSPWRNDEAMIGADVTARIMCDRRSVLSSWFSDVVDFTHRNVLFYFR